MMKRSFNRKAIGCVAAIGIGSLLTANAGGGEGGAFSVTTLTGKAYRGCEVLKVDPDGLTFSHASGIAKISFSELPESVRKKHGYDEDKAKEFVKKHTEVIPPALPMRKAQRGAAGVYYAPAGAQPYVADYGYGYAHGYPYYGYGAGYGHSHGNRQRGYPYYRNYPNVSFQVGPERRLGSPVAPPLISTSNFQNQQRAVQNAAGFPAPKLPVVRPRIATPNRPSRVAPRGAPTPIRAPKLPLGGGRK